MLSRTMKQALFASSIDQAGGNGTAWPLAKTERAGTADLHEIGAICGIYSRWRCGGDEPPGIDPIIAGSLKRLPKSGEVWPETNTFSSVPTPLARFATGQTLPYADRNAYEHSRELAAPWRPSSI